MKDHTDLFSCAKLPCKKTSLLATYISTNLPEYIQVEEFVAVTQSHWWQSLDHLACIFCLIVRLKPKNVQIEERKSTCRHHWMKLKKTGSGESDQWTETRKWPLAAQHELLLYFDPCFEDDVPPFLNPNPDGWGRIWLPKLWTDTTQNGLK